MKIICLKPFSQKLNDVKLAPNANRTNTLRLKAYYLIICKLQNNKNNKFKKIANKLEQKRINTYFSALKSINSTKC